MMDSHSMQVICVTLVMEGCLCFTASCPVPARFIRMVYAMFQFENHSEWYPGRWCGMGLKFCTWCVSFDVCGVLRASFCQTRGYTIAFSLFHFLGSTGCRSNNPYTRSESAVCVFERFNISICNVTMI